MESERLKDARESLKMAETGFMEAAKEMNTAKIRYETAKTLLDAASIVVEKPDHTAEKISTLEIQIYELELEKSKSQTTISSLENDISNLRAELSKRDAEMESLAAKVREVEKQLEQCCKDKKAMEDEKEVKPIVVIPSIPVVKSDKVFFHIDIEGRRVGRIVIKLDLVNTPITAEKFRVLCTGESQYYYKGKKFGAYYSGCIAIEEDDGLDMYGSNFSAENLTTRHIPSAVSLTYKGGSVYKNQFFINTTVNSNRDGEYVVFGHVIEGMNFVLEVQKAGAYKSLIAECGQV